MSDPKLDTDSMVEIPSEVTPDAEGDELALIEGISPPDTEFTPWREEPIPLELSTTLGHRRIVKERNVHQGQPQKIKHEISFEPEPETEHIDVVPLKDGDSIVGLRIECGCGATHEVRFEYSDEE
jgi:hypothetical protein